MSLLAFTPPDTLVDAEGRPCFLWDCELTLDEFRARLTDPDPEVRAYFTAKLMRQAKPDDVFQFVTADEIRRQWPALVDRLGDKREFWAWMFAEWEWLGVA